MFYKKNSNVPFEAHVHLEDWCKTYHLPWKVLQKRVSSGWRLDNALIFPADTGMAEPWKLARAITLIEYGWSDEEIASRCSMKLPEVEGLRARKDEYKDFLQGLDGFWLEPAMMESPNKLVFHTKVEVVA